MALAGRGCLTAFPYNSLKAGKVPQEESCAELVLSLPDVLAEPTKMPEAPQAPGQQSSEAGPAASCIGAFSCAVGLALSTFPATTEVFPSLPPRYQLIYTNPGSFVQPPAVSA